MHNFANVGDANGGCRQVRIANVQDSAGFFGIVGKTGVGGNVNGEGGVAGFGFPCHV